MALRITQPSEPIHVERLNMVLYAAPGIGKTSLAFTAADPLLLDFDAGAYRAAKRRHVVQISQWSDVASITAADVAPFKTIVIDTAGRALDMLATDIIENNPKMGRGGALSLQGYGQLKSRFTAFLKLLNGFGLDTVLLTHLDEQRNGDEVIERLDVQGGSKGEIYKAADAMGRLTIENGQRWLKFSPTDAAFGKNPGQLDPIPVPHFTAPDFDGFLAGIIARTKAKLNELSEDQRAAIAEQEWFREALPKVETADAINELIPRAKQGGAACSALLAGRAKDLGLVYDKDAGGYSAPAQQAAA